MDFYALSTNRNLTKNEIIINDDNLSISITDETVVDRGVHNFNWNINLSELISNYSQDHGCIAVFPTQFVPDSSYTAIETTQLSFPARTGINFSQNHSETMAGKQMAGSPFSVITNNFASYAFLYVLTPYKNCSVDEIVLVFRDAPTGTCTKNGSIITANKLSSMKIFLDSWLPITINGPSSITVGTSESYSISSQDGCIIYLSSDQGIINKSRIKNGGSFLLDSTGLNVGDSIVIKAGYKFWAGITDKTISIV